MQDRIKEHDWVIRLARTQTSAVSEHVHNTGHYLLWDEVKFIDRDPHWYTLRVKEVIHIRLHPNNIIRDSGIEIPEAWMRTIKKHNNRRATKKQATEGAPSRNSEDRNTPITAAVAIYILKWLHRETNDVLLSLSLYHDEQQQSFSWQ